MASYFKEAIDPSQRKKTIIDCEKLLSGIKFDTIVCRGVSGMALGFVLAHLLDKNIYVIRKDEDKKSSHSGGDVGRLRGRYIIIDDFCCSGETIKNITTNIIKNSKEVNTLAAVIFYTRSGYGLEERVLAALEGLNKDEEFKILHRRLLQE